MENNKMSAEDLHREITMIAETEGLYENLEPNKNSIDAILKYTKYATTSLQKQIEERDKEISEIDKMKTRYHEQLLDKESECRKLKSQLSQKDEMLERMAVEFSEWITLNAQPRTTSKNQWKHIKRNVIVSTEELYKEFLKQYQNSKK